MAQVPFSDSFEWQRKACEEITDAIERDASPLEVTQIWTQYPTDILGLMLLTFVELCVDKQRHDLVELFVSVLGVNVMEPSRSYANPCLLKTCAQRIGVTRGENVYRSCMITFIEAGIQPISQMSPLQVPAYYGNEECVMILMKAIPKISPDQVVGAAEQGHIKLLKLLLSESDVNGVDSIGQSAAHGAALHGHADCLEFLIQSGVDLLIQSSFFQETALHLAAGAGHVDCVKVILECGIDPNIMSSSGYTPLHMAAKRGSRECVDMLLEFGSDINRLCRHKRTPAHVAAYFGEYELLEYLESRGASMDISDNSGRIPKECSPADLCPNNYAPS